MENNRRYYMMGIIMGSIGIILLLTLVIFRISYPHILFTVLGSIGLLLVFAGLLIYFLACFFMMKEAIDKRSYSDIIFLILQVMIIFLIILKSIFFK